MKIMWKDLSNSLSPRKTWKKISSKKAESYLKNHFRGDELQDTMILLALGKVIETPTFLMKE